MSPVAISLTCPTFPTHDDLHEHSAAVEWGDTLLVHACSDCAIVTAQMNSAQFRLSCNTVILVSTARRCVGSVGGPWALALFNTSLLIRPLRVSRLRVYPLCNQKTPRAGEHRGMPRKYFKRHKKLNGCGSLIFIMVEQVKISCSGTLKEPLCYLFSRSGEKCVLSFDKLYWQVTIVVFIASNYWAFISIMNWWLIIVVYIILTVLRHFKTCL